MLRRAAVLKRICDRWMAQNAFFIFLLQNCNKRPYNRIHLQALLVNFLLNVLSIINTNFFIILFLINYYSYELKKKGL